MAADRGVAPLLALGLGAGVALAGCGAGAGARAAAVVRDSAGITIVENDPVEGWRAGEPWRLSAEPALDIGVFEGEEVYQLHEAGDAVRLSDGRIVVANAGTRELRFYGPDGRHLRSVGREGGGPGEFQGMHGVELAAGDTILAWDWSALRLSVFSPDGEFVRSVSPTLVDEGFAPQFYGAFDDGSFVLRPSIIPSLLLGTGDGLRRDTTAYARYAAADGTVVDTVALTPGMERFARSSGRGFSVTTIPFARGSFLDVHGRRAYIGVSDRYEIRVHDLDAGLVRIIRRAGDPVPVTDADVDRYAEERAAQSLAPQERDDPSAVRAMADAIRERPRPGTFPAFDDLLVDDVGHLWVREHERPGADGPRAWSVFDEEGHLLGSVETPRGLQIFQIGRDFVLGRARDELEIEHIRLYELNRSTANPNR